MKSNNILLIRKTPQDYRKYRGVENSILINTNQKKADKAIFLSK